MPRARVEASDTETFASGDPTKALLRAETEREALLLLTARVESMFAALSANHESLRLRVDAAASTSDRINSLILQLQALQLQVRWFMAVLIFLISPIYGVAIWTLVAKVVNGH